MFLDDINSFEEKSFKLKDKFLKKCDKCNSLRVIQRPDGNYEDCECAKFAKVKIRLICNGMPMSCVKLNWNNLKNYNKNNIKQIKDYSDDIEENIFNNTNLLINGQDKIEIIELESAMVNDICMLKNIEGNFYNILMITVNDLIQTSNAIRNNSELKYKFDKYLMNNGSCDILILNYLGDELDNRNNITAKLIEDMLVKRILNNKITIISTTLQTEDIVNRYGNQFLVFLRRNFKNIKFVNDDYSSDFYNESGDNSNGYY